MVRNYKCTTEITIHSVSAPGTWLPNRDDVYITIELFNQVKRTRLTDPIFPLIFHDRFTFEKIFWTASDPLEVTEILEDLPVVIELRQVTDVYLGGALLAYFDSNARDFLSPYPSTLPRFEGGRELIMCRTVDFTGISPKLEFTTYTVIENYPNSYLQSNDEPYLGEPVLRSDSRRSRPSSRNSRPKSPGYNRQTVSSALRFVHESPTASATWEENADFQDSGSRKNKKLKPVAVDIRPPFVVRKVDPGMLQRKPELHDSYNGMLLNAQKKRSKRRSRSVSPARHRRKTAFGRGESMVSPRLSCDVCNMTNDTDLALRDLINVPPEAPMIKASRETTNQKPIYEITRNRRNYRSEDDEGSDEDLEVAHINHRSPSPISYYPSLRQRYSPILQSASARISHRVRGAHNLNNSPLTH